MIKLHFTLLIIGTLIDAYLDNYLISKKKNVHNIQQYVVREFVFIMLAIIFSHHDNDYALYSWVLSHFVYWWTFDTALNILRFRSLKFKDLIYLSDRGMDAFQRPLEVAFFVKLLFAVLASLYWFKPEYFQVSNYF